MTDVAKIAISFAIPPAFVALIAYAWWVLVVFAVLILWFGASALIINIWFCVEGKETGDDSLTQEPQ